MNFAHNTWTGGEEYFIRFQNGQHQVMMVTPDYEEENEVCFSGHYEDCLSYLNKLVASNFEYDMNI